MRDSETIKILIAEDNFGAARGAESVLKSAYSKIEFDLAKNGTQAVEKATSQRYDLILMDIGLPDFDGIEATTRIRIWEEKNREPTPIVALTAHAQSEPCLQAGIQRCLVKPLSKHEAGDIINEYVIMKIKEK